MTRSKVIYGEDYVLSTDKRAKLAIYHDSHTHRWVCVLSYGSYEPFRSTLKTKGTGTRGGVRVIYFNVFEDGKIWLLIVYSKSKFDNLPTAFLRELKERQNG